MRFDFHDRIFAWVLLIACAIAFTPALGATAAPHRETAEPVASSPWSELWSSLQEWLGLPDAGDSAAAEDPVEPETDDGPDMDPDG